MATKNETAGALIDSIKADLRTTTTCSNATLAALQRLLLQKNQETEQKENVRVKVQATARRRAGTTTAAATVNVVTKQTVNTLAPREKYILATEVANTTLKTLADVLKNPSVAPVSRPSSKAKSSSSEDARKPTRPRTGHAKGPLVSQRPLMERSASQTHNSPQKRVPRRSSSYSSFSSAGPEAGLVATAECARIAFGYLGTPEAMKVLGKDSQALQYENGVIVLIGKLVALGLDVLAIKELRTLKRRLDKYCTKDSEQQESGAHNGTSTEKESLASLLDFRTIDPKSPALPLIATFQTYALRIIAKLRRPQIIESAWEFLKLSNPSSVANLIWHTAQTPTGQAKTARQLESLAQTILALCPSVSSADDVNQSHPSPGIVLQLQQLAFKIRKRWWTLAKHQGNEEQELLEPFAKCIIAFARRSQLTSTVKYRLAESLCSDLRGQRCDTDAPSPTGSESTTTLNKALCSLAQAAGLSEEALRLLGPAGSTSNSNAPTAKNTSRLVRIATVSLEACLKGEKETDLEVAVADVITSLKGGLGGTAADLESLFVEVNGLRRAATKLLLTAFPSPASEDERSCREQQARSMIAASVHFSARFLGTQLSPEADSKAHERHRQRIATMWKYSKSIVDSILACCKQNVRTQEQWTDIGSLLQESSHIIHRLKEEVESGTKSDTEHLDLLSSHTVKLSNACWAVYLQLRKARLSPECLIEAMEHSVQLLKSSSHYEAEAGHLPMKLEQLGEALENVDRGEPSRKVFEQCIESHLNPKTTRLLADLASKSSLHKTFSCDGLLNVLGRVLKAYHRSFLKFGIKNTEELAFYDDLALEPEIRGSLLEWQLGFFLRTLSRNRQWDSKLDRSIRTLVIRLSELYTPDVFPIRHLRLSSMRLQLAQHDQHCVPEDMMPLQFSQASKTNQTSTKDQGLLRFEGHLQALHNLRSCMQQPYFATKTFRQCFTIWETLLNAASSWDVLVDHIDDIEDWLKEIQVSVEFLNAKGEEYFAIGVLRLLVRILELQNKSDPTDLVTALCALGLQFLRLGYTGKAGLSLAKAESLIKSKAVSTEATLQWHISYAEYLLTIGNNTKCANIMSNAQSLALGDKQFMDLAKSTTTLSGRIRFNRLLADAAYVQSLLAAAVGSYKEAAQHAKQCVSLNRRIWAALESRAAAKKQASIDDNDSGAGNPSKVPFDPLSSLRSDSGVPLVISVTHDALSGADFWSLIPALYRGMMQHSQIFINQGLLHEAIYLAEQADKVASATKSPTLMIDNTSWRADCWAQSGRHDKAEKLLESLSEASSRKCLSSVGFHSAVARIHHCNGRYEEEMKSYAIMEHLLNDLASATFIDDVQSFLPSVDALAVQVGNMSLDVPEPQAAKRLTVTRGRKPVTRPAARAATKSVAVVRARATTATGGKRGIKAKDQPPTPPLPETSSIADHCCVLSVFKASVADRKILANILQDDLSTALDLLRHAEEVQNGLDREMSHMWVTFKTKLAQSVKQIAEDITVNTLPESTIAFPAIGLKERRSSEGIIAKKTAPAAPTTVKGGRARKQSKENFIDTLRDARDRLVEAHSLCATIGSNHSFQQISMALSQITILLSAVSGTELHGSLHPLYAAYMSEIPKYNSLRLCQDSIDAEKQQISREDCLRWPASNELNVSLPSLSDFQAEYVDIIPPTWSAVSMALNEDRDELYITRFESGLSPFVLRLPLSRHASRDMDEEEFSFEDGKRDFDEIIELSDFSTRTAKDMTSREARQQWWAEREALDTRLHELLVNMENIWLGGFKGVFSQHERQTSLLARFRKSFENILNQNLPSRQKKTQQKRPVLDTRVLDLFIGLGDATNEELDLDEALMDLIYFVVDILHFNGERNAYDEVDFDAMVVEMHDALRAYHSASQNLDTESRHTILILDKSLHAFPWESLPCLEQLSISRLPSLAALRERLLAARPSTDGGRTSPGHYISMSAGGTSILNPSGDLAHTSKTIKPRLDELQGPWNHIANRTPSEKEFEDSLREKDLVLYFGHGSGAQYIKSKSVRRLYPGQQDEATRQPACATTLLFGCSSVHLTENGIYEPSGMLASYLTAGAPAVVGMLWDVTDKDCDRFAVKAGELWGLWPEPLDDDLPPKTPAKTPAKKTKGKGRVAQLVDEVEGVRGTPGGKRGKKGTETLEEEMKAGGKVHSGMGLDEAVRGARKACVLKYLNGAAAVVYGIPVYLE